VSAADWRDAFGVLPDAVPDEEIAAAIGELERVKAALLARLVQPEVQQPTEDPLLTAKQVAERLQVDCKWVYGHKADLGGVSLSRRKLRFPLSEVERYLRRRKAASTRR